MKKILFILILATVFSNTFASSCYVVNYSQAKKMLEKQNDVNFKITSSFRKSGRAGYYNVDHVSLINGVIYAYHTFDIIYKGNDEKVLVNYSIDKKNRVKWQGMGIFKGKVINPITYNGKLGLQFKLYACSQ